MSLDLTNEEILNIPLPNLELKSKILEQECEDTGIELPQQAKNFLLQHSFKNVREMVEKIILYTAIPGEQATEELFEHIFNPAQTNVILPKFAHKVHCGFVSPAEDYLEGYLSLDKKFIKNPASTFPVQAEGDCMRETIHDGDILLVDASLEARHGDIILAVIDGEFTMKRLHKESNKQIILVPDNPVYSSLTITEGLQFEIRGVVTSIHRHLR